MTNHSLRLKHLLKLHLSKLWEPHLSQRSNPRSRCALQKQNLVTMSMARNSSCQRQESKSWEEEEEQHHNNKRLPSQHKSQLHLLHRQSIFLILDLNQLKLNSNSLQSHLLSISCHRKIHLPQSMHQINRHSSNQLTSQIQGVVQPMHLMLQIYSVGYPHSQLHNSNSLQQACSLVCPQEPLRLHSQHLVSKLQVSTFCHRHRQPQYLFSSHHNKSRLQLLIHLHPHHQCQQPNSSQHSRLPPPNTCQRIKLLMMPGLRVLNSQIQSAQGPRKLKIISQRVMQCTSSLRPPTWERRAK